MPPPCLRKKVIGEFSIFTLSSKEEALEEATLATA